MANVVLVRKVICCADNCRGWRDGSVFGEAEDWRERSKSTTCQSNTSGTRHVNQRRTASARCAVAKNTHLADLYVLNSGSRAAEL